jgi:hypothetical protein
MVRTLACVGVCLVVLSACGSDEPMSTKDSPATAVPSPSTATPASSAERPAPSTENAPANAGDRCVAADLTGTVANADAGAGNRYADLVVTNTGDAACTLYGYGGLEFFGANGKSTPTELVRVPDPGPVLVTLAPGATAAKKLRWSVIASGGEPTTGPCQPPSTGIRVIPPDDTRAFTVSYDFGPVCSGGRVEGSAYVAN